MATTQDVNYMLVFILPPAKPLGNAELVHYFIPQVKKSQFKTKVERQGILYGLYHTSTSTRR